MAFELMVTLICSKSGSKLEVRSRLAKVFPYLDVALSMRDSPSTYSEDIPAPSLCALLSLLLLLFMSGRLVSLFPVSSSSSLISPYLSKGIEFSTRNRVSTRVK